MVNADDLQSKNTGQYPAMFRANPKGGLRQLGYTFDKKGLEKAVKDGKAEAVKIFIKESPELAKKSFLEMARKGTTIKPFLDAGMNPHTSDGGGRTALMLAASASNGEAFSELMIHFGEGRLKKAHMQFALDAVDLDGKTVLMHAAYSRNDVKVNWILSQLDKDAIQKQGPEAMRIAARAGNTEIIKALDENKVSVNAVDPDGLATPLIYAVAEGKTETVKWLIENGADPNFHQSNGETALHIAVRLGNVEMVRTLLDYRDRGLSINNSGPNGLTPMNYALDVASDEIVDLLKGKGALRADDIEQRKRWNQP
jgi:ankyrin repeat protein